MKKYQDVKRSIYERIQTGEFSAGDVLPSERELIEQYQVSRITVRQAISGLVNEGLVYSVQGKGTYVQSRARDLHLLRLTSCTEDIRNLGYIPSKKVISKEIQIPTANIRADLELDDGEKTLNLARIYYANKNPVNFTITNLAFRHFPGIEVIDFGIASLYETLQTKYGLTILHAKRKIEAALPSKQIADYLMMNISTPILLFSCITYGDLDGAEFPFESYISWYRSDSYSFYIDQVGGGETASKET